MVTTAPDREGMEIDGESYELLEVSPGRIQWLTEEVESQLGEGAKPIPVPLQFHSGFGATHRFQMDGQPTDRGHHNFSINASTRHAGIIAPSPRITFLDLSTISARSKGFQFGGSLKGRFGGSTASFGAGSFTETPQIIRQFGDFLYISSGIHTHVVDPAATTPDLKETRNHGASARARSSDVWDNQLPVALGSTVDAEVATNPRSGTLASVWATATDVQRSVFKAGKTGRLFSAQDNLVFQVNPGQDPTDSTKYNPPAGEPIVDETDEIRNLAEYLDGLIAGTSKQLRTFDPDAGFQGRGLTPRQRLSASDFDGRSILDRGDGSLLYATTRGVKLFRRGFEPQDAGPELLTQNESPYVGGQPGLGDFFGEWSAIPYFFPTTGDSVVFWVRDRRPNEPGTGPLLWADELFLEDRECRTVFFWGGTSTVKPRIFLGAGSSVVAGNPEQLGWADLGRTSPDIFDTDAQPAISASVFGAADDMGTPGVIGDIERVEFPLVQNADATNFFVCSVDPDGDGAIDLVKDQTGASDPERVDGTGFQQVFAPTGDIPSGRELAFQVVFTQASAATSFVIIRAEPIAYISFRPVKTKQVTTLLDVKPVEDLERVADILKRLEDLSDGSKVEFKGAPGLDDFFAKVISVREVIIEVTDVDAKTENRTVVEIVFRTVATS